MSNDNVTLIGNLTRDPELRFTPTGRSVTQLGMAVNRRYQVQGEWKEDVSFFDVVAWGELGENVTASCGKGTRVIVNGRLTQRSWKNEADETRSKVEVVADDIGPALRWATAQVLRTERAPANGDPGPSHPQDVAGTTPDEEPF
jgi:single-strand DNA-binding protein